MEDFNSMLNHPVMESVLDNLIKECHIQESFINGTENDHLLLDDNSELFSNNEHFSFETQYTPFANITEDSASKNFQLVEDCNSLTFEVRIKKV